MASKMITTDDGTSMTIPEMLKSIERFVKINFSFFSITKKKFSQVQSKTLSVLRKICAGTSQGKHLRPECESGSLEILSVQPTLDEFTNYKSHPFESHYKSSIQRLGALQVSSIAQPNA
jgi:hypothetical protein